MQVVAPSTPADAKGLLRTAIRNNNPVLFLEHLALYSHKGEVPEGDYTIPFGQAKVTKEGKDLTVISYSRKAAIAHNVASRLERENKLSVEVVDIRSLRPLDRETLVNSVKKTAVPLSLKRTGVPMVLVLRLLQLCKRRLLIIWMLLLCALRVLKFHCHIPNHWNWLPSLVHRN